MSVSRFAATHPAVVELLRVRVKPKYLCPSNLSLQSQYNRITVTVIPVIFLLLYFSSEWRSTEGLNIEFLLPFHVNFNNFGLGIVGINCIWGGGGGRGGASLRVISLQEELGDGNPCHMSHKFTKSYQRKSLAAACKMSMNDGSVGGGSGSCEDTAPCTHTRAQTTRKHTHTHKQRKGKEFAFRIEISTRHPACQASGALKWKWDVTESFGCLGLQNKRDTQTNNWASLATSPHVLARREMELRPVSLQLLQV